MSWDHPSPVFLDFETQSACNLKEVGGRLYAQHMSTRILIMAVTDGETYHVWIPQHVGCRIPSIAKLWPHQLQHEKKVVFYDDATIPIVIRDLIESKPVVAHNAFGFDKFIADECLPSVDIEWLDSMYVARACGRVGRLDQLGKQIAGFGKDRAKKLLPLLTTATVNEEGYTVYPYIKPGDLQAFTTYAIADVELIVRLWKEFDDVTIEADVIEVHNKINERGVAVDTKLLRHIEKLSQYSQSTAMGRITELSDGIIIDAKVNNGRNVNIRSGPQMKEWLDYHGVQILDDNGKPCLRKEIVQRFIDSPYLLGNIEEGEETRIRAMKEIPPEIIEILALRMRALRITDAKVSKALDRVNSDSRIRDLLSYHTAHTGRFSSSGMQIHNLPRPMAGIDIERIVKYLETVDPADDVRITFDSIKSMLPTEVSAKVPRLPSMDDVCSALIRPSIVAGPGMLFAIADYSQIEARGVAVIAGEEKLIAQFRKHADVYKEFATFLYATQYESVTDLMRQVSKVVILGSGYNMGVDKFRIYAANQGVDLVKAGITAQECIDKYRDTYKAIAGWKPDKNKTYRVQGIWHKLDKAVMDAVTKRTVEEAGRCIFHMRKNNLICQLPSGRELWYPDAKIEDVIPPYCYTMNLPLNPKATVTYLSHRGRKSLYGGLITENVVQAICADILRDHLVEFDRIKLATVLHVHDEPINEVWEKEAEQALEKMIRIMSTPPSWMPDFPMAAEGFISPRFVKKPWKGYREISSKSLGL